MAVTGAAIRRLPAATFGERFVRFWNRYLLFIYTGLAIVYLMAPVAVMALFSFNDPAGKSNFVWQGFTINAWQNIFDVPGLQSAVAISLGIAFASTIVATILGTLIALALARHSFRGRSATTVFIFLPMAPPDHALGAAPLPPFGAIGPPPLRRGSRKAFRHDRPGAGGARFQARPHYGSHGCGRTAGLRRPSPAWRRPWRSN